MSRPISYSHQSIEDDDVNAVTKALMSDYITQGPKVKEFEDALSSYCNTKYAAVFSSGTAALHAAYAVAGIEKGDEIITSPITFLSTANAALFRGARPVFTDIEPTTGNMNPNLIEDAITEQTKAIVPVDFGGHPADLQEIADIARTHNLLLIEDACHALGADYKGGKIGSCEYSDMVVLSFHPVKSITTGEGGAVLTDNAEYCDKLTMFRHHGVTKDKSRFKLESNDPGDWYYEMHSLGYNYRLTDIQCSLGISQLRKLDRFIKRRREIEAVYAEAFKDNGFFDPPLEKDYAKSSWHLYPIRLKDQYKNKKKQIFKGLKKEKVGIQVHYIPVYWQPYYQELGYKKGICPVAEDFYDREISIQLFPSMSSAETVSVANTVLKVFENI